jgi:hypothetical protein
MPLNFSHDRSNWSSPSFSSTTFQNFPDIYDLFSEVSKFRHHTKPCSKCSTLLVSSLSLSPFCWWKEPSTLCIGAQKSEWRHWGKWWHLVSPLRKITRNGHSAHRYTRCNFRSCASSLRFSRALSAGLPESHDELLRPAHEEVSDPSRFKINESGYFVNRIAIAPSATDYTGSKGLVLINDACNRSAHIGQKLELLPAHIGATWIWAGRYLIFD